MKSKTHVYVNLKDLVEKSKPKKKITLKEIFHNIKIKLKSKK
mgnify:FL=1|jgi:hypothetical protein